MQKINYKENILLDSQIEELLMINIDERLNQGTDNDCIKINGEIKISGEVKTKDGNKSFNHPISVDILLSKDQLDNDKISINIDDFNYKINNQTIEIDLFMKIYGLKEIQAYFPAQEDKENIEIEENTTIDIIEEETRESIIEESPTNEESEKITYEENNEKMNKQNYSLLSQVFKNKNIKKESTYLLHVVKNETSYQEIASLYNIEINKLRSANNDEEIYKDKLIFIPKS